VSVTHPQGIELGRDSAPFNLDSGADYARWRAHKLDLAPPGDAPRPVPIARLGRLDAAEKADLIGACRRSNFVIYQSDPGIPLSREALREFGRRLGLVNFDHHLWAPEEGIVALRREPGERRGDYIPYTDRAMKWHTDGYYNAPGAAVRGVIMHCVTPTAEGGGNGLLDPELVYIAVRDADPAYIEALMQPDVMSIPGNRLEPGAERPAVSGPVFSIDPVDGNLHMRYTARTRSIHWKNQSVTREAVAFLDALLTPPVEFATRVCLRAGEGIVCNNVLHNREAFTDGDGDGQQRLLWRARYRERIADTSGWQDRSP
jgi:hypothetical protein